MTAPAPVSQESRGPQRSTAVGINTEAASAAQKPTSEKTAQKPFVPLTGRTPESIPSHLDLHEASQKTTKRPQETQAEVTSDE